MAHNKHRFRAAYKRFIGATRRYVPPGLRLFLGLALVTGGVFGFLPVLGFWMIPLGITVAALDVRPLWHLIRQRLSSQ